MLRPDQCSASPQLVDRDVPQPDQHPEGHIVACLLAARRIIAFGLGDPLGELAGAAYERGDHLLGLIGVDRDYADVIDRGLQAACGQVRHYLGIDPGWSDGPGGQVSPEAEVVAGPARLGIG